MIEEVTGEGIAEMTAGATKIRHFGVRGGKLDVRFRARGRPIVGTSLDYFPFRQLTLESGRHFGMLGECVLGARAAELSLAGVGQAVMSAPGSVFDIAGVYPLKMKVVGSENRDDIAWCQSIQGGSICQRVILNRVVRVAVKRRV